MQPDIPFNKPFIIGRELDYIREAVDLGHLAGDGVFTRKCQDWIQERFKAHRVLLTHSGSTALDMSALLANIKAGDEVIMPSYTFVSTANAFVLRGATIRFIDIRPDTLNMDESLLEAAINNKTRAIVPVHYAGVGCEMDSIMALAAKHDLIVIEDAAQAVNAMYRDRYLGTIGHLASYSFHETKNFISGEGGALVVNDPEFLERAEIIREKGTNRPQFFRGETDKYTWVDVGSSFLPSELMAAFLFAQLEAADRITEKRMGIFDAYMRGLKPLADQELLRLPVIPPTAGHNAHMFYVLLQKEAVRKALIQHLKDAGIMAVFHYVPLHLSPVGQDMGYQRGDFPITEDLSSRLLRLPCFFEFTEEQQARVISAVTSFFRS